MWRKGVDAIQKNVGHAQLIFYAVHVLSNDVVSVLKSMNPMDIKKSSENCHICRVLYSVQEYIIAS